MQRRDKIKEKAICIIPARGGSKRIKRKNLVDFLGKPLISYSLENALNCGIFEEVYVSSDDEEILEFAKSFKGVKILKRKEELSGDYVGTREVILDCIEELGLGEDVWVCCLYATAPLLREEHLQIAYKERKEESYVFPAVAYSYSPFRAFKIENGSNKMLFKEHFSKRSQDLEAIYHDVGAFYLAKAKTWQNKENIFEDSKCIIVSELEAQDIDNYEDLELAKMKYEMMRNEIYKT
ncbi:pseudaminic acid cytidylyltransferase [Helicobacter burdigaliensis]|uniref:pseudaminic acid cytidylyltransferase n=1 Tax=Helicobacter burdigaliensis TaxID=2315334 RepID=UPI001E4091FD|nr:pseudaminic acid cytidylyltransferase [Helicobacter burdigaliensis]